MDTYHYTKLTNGQIRVLSVQRPSTGTLLKCNLRPLALASDDSVFRAMSWTWGDEPAEKDLVEIEMDGRTMLVWPSAYEVLNALSKQKHSQWYWLDAICMNQTDKAEMDQQLPLMADIYIKAEGVLIWLGKSKDDSDHVMEVISTRNQQAHEEARFVTALFQLMQRLWWERTWIVQEFALNKRTPMILCGDAPAVSSDVVLDVFDQARTNLSPTTVATLYSQRIDVTQFSSRYMLKSIRQRRQVPDPTTPLNMRNALTALRSFQVTKPIDKVYGILGILDAATRDHFRQRFGINTTISMEEVYHQAAIYVLQQEKSCTMLCEFPLGQIVNRPSWVPDFNTNIVLHKRSTIPLVNVTSPRLDNAMEDVEISDDQMCLTVRGHLIDTVANIEQVPAISLRTLDAVQLQTNIVSLVQLLHKISNMLKERSRDTEDAVELEPLWQTLIAGGSGFINDAELRNTKDCEARFDEWMEINTSDTSGPHIVGIWLQMAKKPHILNKIDITMSQGRCFYTGAQGSYGITDPGAQHNDIIALLFPEHYIPVVLRKKGDAYQVIGTAYIPEKWRERVLEDKSRELKSFKLI